MLILFFTQLIHFFSLLDIRPDFWDEIRISDLLNKSGPSGPGGPSGGPGGGPGGGPSNGFSAITSGSEARGHDRNNAIQELDELAQRVLYKQEGYDEMTAQQKKDFINKEMKRILAESAEEIRDESKDGPKVRKTNTEVPEYNNLFNKLMFQYKKK